MGLLTGKTGLIVGIANERSYAWHIAKALSDHGATCAYTHLPGEKNERRTKRSLEELNQSNAWLHPMDAAKDEDIDAALIHGPAMRWAVQGTHLTYHLGGGPGGIRHYLDHLGPSQERRWATLGKVQLTADVKKMLIDGIEREANGRSVADLEAALARCRNHIATACRTHFRSRQLAHLPPRFAQQTVTTHACTPLARRHGGGRARRFALAESSPAFSTARSPR